MKQALENLIDTSLPAPGVAACAALLPDNSLVGRSYNPWLENLQIEPFLKSLSEAAKNLQRHELQPLELCWIYEYAKIYFRARPDGACFVVFVENREGFDSVVLDQLFAGFASL